MLRGVTIRRVVCFQYKAGYLIRNTKILFSSIQLSNLLDHVCDGLLEDCEAGR